MKPDQEILKNFYLKYLQLTEQLQQSIMEQDYEGIEHNLNKRQEMIEQINSFLKVQPADPLNLDIENIIQQIKKMDKDITQDLINMRQELKQKLNKVNDSKVAHKKYNPTYMQSSGYFLDKKK